MKQKQWKLLVLLVLAFVPLSYLFLFPEGKTEPYLFSLPYTIWMGILVTAVLVLLTFLAKSIFPFKEDNEL